MNLTIKNKIVISFVTLLLIPVIILSVLNFTTINQLSSQNAEDSANALINAELQNLNRTAIEQSSYVSGTLNEWASQINMIALYTESVFNGQISLNHTNSYYWNSTGIPGQQGDYTDMAPYFSPYISFNTSAYYMPYSVVVTDHVNPLNPGPDIQKVIDTSAGLDNVFKSIHQANSKWVWLYAQFNLPGKIFRNYPFDNMANFFTDEQANLSNNFLNYDFYTQAVAVGNNHTAFISPYFDDYVGLIVSISEPVYFTNGTLFGVVSGDITISEITNSITAIKVLNHGYAYLLDKNNDAWAHPALTDKPKSIFDLEFSSPDETNSFKTILQNIDASNSSGQLSYIKNGQIWYLSYVHVPISNQVLFVTVPESDIIIPANAVRDSIANLTFVQLSLMALLLTLAIVFIIILGTWVAGRIVKPIKELTNLLDFISQGDLSRDLKEKQESMEVEIGLLHGAFNNLLTSLRFGNKDYYRGDLNRAHQNYLKALELFETTNNQRGIAIAKNNLGNIYRLWGDFESARKNYTDSIAIGHELQDQKGLASRLNNLAILFIEEKKYDQAISFLSEAITYDQNIGNVKGMSIRFSNLGLVYQKMGDHKQALSFYNKGITSDEQYENKRGLGYGHLNLGSFYLESSVKDLNKAEDELRASLKIAEEFDEVNLALLSLQKLEQVYGQKHDTRNFSLVSNKIIEIKRFMASKKYVFFVIDYSGSMDGVRIRSAVQGAIEIYSTIINPQDYVGIIIFNSKIEKIQDLLNVQYNDELIRRNLRGLRYPSSMTAFYDALGLSLEDLGSLIGNEQKWIISLTDGLDNSSHKYTIKNKKPTIYTKIFGVHPTPVQQYIKKSLLNVNLIIVGIGQELEKVEGDFTNLISELPRGKYIPIKEQYQVEKAIENAFKEVQEMMAQVDIEGFSFDD